MYGSPQVPQPSLSRLHCVAGGSEYRNARLSTQSYEGMSTVDLEAGLATSVPLPGSTSATKEAVAFQSKSIAAARWRGRLEGAVVGAFVSAVIAVIIFLAAQLRR